MVLLVGLEVCCSTFYELSFLCFLQARILIFLHFLGRCLSLMDWWLFLGSSWSFLVNFSKFKFTFKAWDSNQFLTNYSPSPLPLLLFHWFQAFFSHGVLWYWLFSNPLYKKYCFVSSLLPHFNNFIFS